ncbi:MAG: class I SAM-dependent methyltransferase [Halodesulfurarchaeum sp.]
MPGEEDPIRERVRRHFAADADRADVWKGLERFLNTEAYLNLGFSRWYQPHWLPSSQRRLVDFVGWLLMREMGDRPASGSGQSPVPSDRDLVRSFARFEIGRLRRSLESAGWVLDVLRYGPPIRPDITDPGGRSERGLDTPWTSIESNSLSTLEGPVLDLGCGRGGPAIRLSERWGLDVVGVDLVPSNVVTARENVRTAGEDRTPEFLVGDAARLPLASGSMGACTAIDSLVYMGEKRAVFEEVARVLERDGVLVLTDLVTAGDGAGSEGATSPGDTKDDADSHPVSQFAGAWDMPELVTRADLTEQLRAAGFDVRMVADISQQSIRQFRKYATLYSWLAAGPLEPGLAALCRRLGMDEAVVTAQVRAARRGLPHLEHVAIVAVAGDS